MSLEISCLLAVQRIAAAQGAIGPGCVSCGFRVYGADEDWESWIRALQPSTESVETSTGLQGWFSCWLTEIVELGENVADHFEIKGELAVFVPTNISSTLSQEWSLARALADAFKQAANYESSEIKPARISVKIGQVLSRAPGVCTFDFTLSFVGS